jgi:SAM-dependent methyltransferase
MLHMRHPRDRAGDRQGHCSVCGSETRFVRNRWVLPAELARTWHEGYVDRESLLCATCGSSSRVRGVADALVGLYGAGATSMAELVEEERFRSLDVLELNAIGRMHPVLARLPKLTYAEYPEEDVTALSYTDSTFDLVLTSDTLEHVEDPMRGLREIHRVLRPGGRHVFTVPIDPELDTSRSRAGRPAEFHGRGGGPFSLVTRKADMLAHTDFGADLPDWLGLSGFGCQVYGSGIDSVFVATARLTMTAAAQQLADEGRASPDLLKRLQADFETGRVGVVPSVEHGDDGDEVGLPDPLTELAQPDVVHVDPARKR